MKLFYPTPTPSKLLPYLAVGAVALIALALLDASLFNEAQAAIGKGGADPFTAATAKADEATTYLTGTIAISITAMVIAVVGILMLMGRVSHMLGVRIMGGALLIGSAVSIAAWLYA